MTLRRTLRWLIPGLLAYLIFLVATFPAAYLLHWLKPDPRSLQLGAISGNVWSGQAGQLVIQGVPLGRVGWHFDWRAPWSGKLGYRLHVQGGTLNVAGRADIGRNRQIVLRTVTGRLPVVGLDHWMPLPSNSVDGLLQLNLKSVTLASNGFPIAAVVGPRALMDAATRTWISSTLATEFTALAAAEGATPAAAPPGRAPCICGGGRGTDNDPHLPQARLAESFQFGEPALCPLGAETGRFLIVPAEHVHLGAQFGDLGIEQVRRLCHHEPAERPAHQGGECVFELGRLVAAASGDGGVGAGQRGRLAGRAERPHQPVPCPQPAVAGRDAT